MDARRVRGVLQVSTADVAGGAERIALQLHLAYLASGLPSVLAVGTRSSDHPGVVAIELSAGEAIRIETPGGGGWGTPP